MKFTKSHEWVQVEGDVATIGITAYAAEQLGDVVFVELPDVGKTVKAGDPLAVVESVKAASDVYAPISGEVVAVNASAYFSRPGPRIVDGLELLASILHPDRVPEAPGEALTVEL